MQRLAVFNVLVVAVSGFMVFLASLSCVTADSLSGIRVSANAVSRLTVFLKSAGDVSWLAVVSDVSRCYISTDGFSGIVSQDVDLWSYLCMSKFLTWTSVPYYHRYCTYQTYLWIRRDGEFEDDPAVKQQMYFYTSWSKWKAWIVQAFVWTTLNPYNFEMISPLISYSEGR